MNNINNYNIGKLDVLNQLTSYRLCKNIDNMNIKK